MILEAFSLFPNQENVMRNQVKNRLTHKTHYKLCQAIGIHAEKLMGERMPWTEAAAFLSKELGFGVNKQQVQECAKLVGISWEPKGQHATGGISQSKYRQRIEALETEVNTLKLHMERLTKTQGDQGAEIAQLRRLVHHLFKDLGAAVPSWYILPTDNNSRIADTPILNQK